MGKNNMKLATIILVLALIICGFESSNTFADSKKFNGRYVTGDFHTHTYLTDGNKTQTEVVQKAFKSYGLDWMANSEHGGTSSRDPLGNSFIIPNNTTVTSLWRWITLKDYSFPIIEKLQKQYSDKVLIQGLEWNVPTHEHASVAILGNSVNPISDFEYMFDENDKDTSRATENIKKVNKTHADAVVGAKWLQTKYRNSSYFILNHPSRKLKYSINDIRDFNDAAPDVFFGMEGFPGHQKEVERGGYTSTDYKAETYGGADYMTAQVGGVWDALLGEGRRFWIFVNSDFHDSSDTADFWPGEYAKSYTYVKENTAQGIVNGMRSGNSFAVQGDLINNLDFKISQNIKGNKTNVAEIGETLKTIKNNKDITITIKFKSPNKNNNNEAVKVNHIDLIAGDVMRKALLKTAEYTKDTNETTKVIKRFNNSDWKMVDGWNVITYTVKNVNKDMYFRLRGTNLAANTPNETDADGNPLADELVGDNNATKAYSDLWFYSNPIFVRANK